MKVIGTAGHVDHGKSTLVLALTGSPFRVPTTGTSMESAERTMSYSFPFSRARSAL